MRTRAARSHRDTPWGIRTASSLLIGASMAGALACRAESRPVPPATTDDAAPTLPSKPTGAPAKSSASALASSAPASIAPNDSPTPVGSTSRDPSASGDANALVDDSAPSRACHIAALGDSLTDARSHGGGYLKTLAKRCPESRFSNFGKGGDMVNQMKRRFVSDVLPRAATEQYTHLIVFGGVNDLYSDQTAHRTVEKIRRDLSFIYQRAREHGMRVVAVTVAPWGGFSRWFTPERGRNTRALNTWILSERDRGGIDAVVDAHRLLACEDPDRLCPEYTRPFGDGLHFGPPAHEKLGAALWAAAFRDCR